MLGISITSNISRWILLLNIQSRLFAYNDSANLDMERDLMQKMQAIYDYDRWKNVAHNEEIKATRANLTLLVSILVSVSVIIIGILTFLVYRKKESWNCRKKKSRKI